MPGAKLGQDAVAVYLPRRARNVQIAIGDQNPQFIADFLETSEIHDKIDHRLLVGKRIVGQVAGPHIDAVQPAHEIPGALHFIEPFAAQNFRAYIFAVDDQDSRPRRMKSGGNVAAVSERPRDAMDCLHDRRLRSFEPSRKDAHRGAFHAFPNNALFFGRYLSLATRKLKDMPVFLAAETLARDPASREASAEFDDLNRITDRTMTTIVFFS